MLRLLDLYAGEGLGEVGAALAQALVERDSLVERERLQAVLLALPAREVRREVGALGRAIQERLPAVALEVAAVPVVVAGQQRGLLGGVAAALDDGDDVAGLYGGLLCPGLCPAPASMPRLRW